MSQVPADLEKLPVKDARAEVSGASRGTVDAYGKLDVYVSGASNLYYVGNPAMGIIDITGASSIHRK
jgi:hypothetical protein